MNIETIAKAIIASGALQSKKFATDEHKKAMDYIAKNSENPVEMVENLQRIGNVSAVRQELEKGGVLPMPQSDTALIRAIKAAQA